MGPLCHNGFLVCVCVCVCVCVFFAASTGQFSSLPQRPEATRPSMSTSFPLHGRRGGRGKKGTGGWAFFVPLWVGFTRKPKGKRTF